MIKYKEYPQHQYVLLPPSLEELIDPKHLVRIIDKFVNSLSKTIWDRAFTGGGAPSYHPQMMLKIILYAYSCKIYSCRDIARAVRQDVTFMWLTGMKQPNFNTINRFRSDYFKDIIEEVFTELLDLLKQKNYVTFSDFFVDGTKLEADARRYSHVWAKNTERYKEAVQKRVKQLLADIDTLNLEEDKKYGDSDLPERGESADITSQEIEDVAKNLSDRLTETADKEQTKTLTRTIKKLETESEKLAKYEQQEHLLNGRNSYSKTDPDATFMRLKDDQLRAAYNVQISTENQFVTNYSISQNASDSAAFVDHLEKIINRGQQYLPDNYMSDSAYGTDENYTKLEKNNINNYFKYNTFHRDQKGKTKEIPFHHDNFIYNEADDTFICPIGKRLYYQETVERESKTGFISYVRKYECEDCSQCIFKQQCTKTAGNRTLYYNPALEQHKARARDNLNSEHGIELRRRRGFEVETPFGDIKHNRSFRRFHLRGLPKVENEFGLLCIGYNFRKIALKEMKKAA